MGEASCKVLVGDELEWLLKVKTTPHMAWQIRERNLGLLDILRRVELGLSDDDKDDFAVSIGCPHCDRVRGKWRCCTGSSVQGCDWLVDGAPWMGGCDVAGMKEKLHQWGTSLPCAAATFGGVPLFNGRRNDMLVSLGANRAYIKLDLEPTPERVERARTFLQGHVEWAEAVLDAAKITVREARLPFRRGIDGWVAAPADTSSASLRGDRPLFLDRASLRDTKFRVPFDVEPLLWHEGDWSEWRDQKWEKKRKN